MKDSRQVERNEDRKAIKELNKKLEVDIFEESLSPEPSRPRLTLAEYQAFDHIFRNSDFTDCHDGLATAKRMFEVMWQTMKNTILDNQAMRIAVKDMTDETFKVAATSADWLAGARRYHATLDIIAEDYPGIVEDAKAELKSRIAKEITEKKKAAH